MKTLILNGSPRKHGDTMALIETVLENLEGEYKLVNCYESHISPCIDCRYCWTHSGCCVQDEMQEVYDYLVDCDNVLIASPIYFFELTGTLLNVGSRLQHYWYAKFFRKENPLPKKKKGAVILVGGGSGDIKRPFDTACMLLDHMSAYDRFPLVSSHNTDRVPAKEDLVALEGAAQIAAFFNARSEHA